MDLSLDKDIVVRRKTGEKASLRRRLQPQARRVTRRDTNAGSCCRIVN